MTLDAPSQALTIIQARTSSSRLPGKVLKPMAGLPMLELMLQRVRRDNPVPTVVATSDDPTDDPVATLCARVGVPVVRGPLHDVLARFIRVIDQFTPQTVVRLTGDNPFSDAQSVIDGLSAYHAARKALPGDWAGISNHLADRSDPHGYAVEVIDADQLRWLDRQELNADEREHVTLGLIHRDVYRSFHLLDGDLSALRWTVDHPEDHAYMCRLFDALGTRATAQEAARWSRDHPHPSAHGAHSS